VLLLVFLGIRQWVGRPADDAEPKLPGWMKAVDTLNAAKATGIGFAVSAVNPKNLAMRATAGSPLRRVSSPVGAKPSRSGSSPC